MAVVCSKQGVRVIPTSAFSIGNDWTIDIFDPLNGGIQSWSLLTGFSKKQNTTRITSNALDGRTRLVDLPDTYEGTMTFDRASPAIDNYFAARDEAYYQGRVQPPVTLTETIKEVDGGISQWRYEDVSLTYDNGGNAQGKDKVEVSVNWIAGRRRKVV
jgi:hypothetical protein